MFSVFVAGYCADATYGAIAFTIRGFASRLCSFRKEFHLFLHGYFYIVSSFFEANDSVVSLFSVWLNPNILGKINYILSPKNKIAKSYRPSPLFESTQPNRFTHKHTNWNASSTTSPLTLLICVRLIVPFCFSEISFLSFGHAISEKLPVRIQAGTWRKQST